LPDNFTACGSRIQYFSRRAAANGLVALTT
jgi:hypothetical protein